MSQEKSKNLSLSLDQQAELRPDHPAIVEGGRSITYRELAERTVAAADRLKNLGVTQGQRIGLRLPNGSLYIALTYAIWRCGATVVPIAMELKKAEVNAIRPSQALAGLIEGVREGNEVAGHDHWDFVPYEAPETAGPGADMDLAFVRFTSGTTGRHKGVALSHASIAERIAAANRELAIGPQERILWVLPMSYHFVVTIVLYLANGATILLPRSTLAPVLVEMIRRHRPTVLYAAPFHYRMLAGADVGPGLDDVRLALSTAMGLPAEIHDAFRASTGIAVAQAYGIIELGLVCINSDAARELPGFVGRPLPDFEVRLRSHERDTGSGTFGEVLVRGPGFFDAYCDPWTTREEVCEDGWFATGDLGQFDDAGRLELVGRNKEVIITAGMKVFPQEVEAVLNAHERVTESRVFGRDHARFGQIVDAEVVVPPGGDPLTSAELLGHAKVFLAPYKMPIRIEFVDAIRKTASGKIARD